MATVVTDPKLVADALEVINSSAKMNPSKEDPNKPETIVERHSESYNVNKTDYVKFMKAHGLSPETMELATSLNQAWNTAGLQFSSARLAAKAADAIKDKPFVEAGGMKAMKVGVKTSVCDGSVQTTVKAYSEGRNPSIADPAEALTKSFGQCIIRHKITRGFDSEAVASIADETEKLFRGKF
jgi:hypothetical protein